MKRDARKAIEEMIDAFEANAIGEVGTLADMARLARLGASVAEPSEEEIEAMARAITAYIRNTRAEDRINYRGKVLAILASLKDRANV